MDSRKVLQGLDCPGLHTKQIKFGLSVKCLSLQHVDMF